MVEKLKDAASFLYCYLHTARPKLVEMTSTKNWLKPYRKTTGRPQPTSCMRSPMQLTTSSTLLMQLEMAAHQRVYLGKAQEEQELEENSQGMTIQT